MSTAATVAARQPSLAEIDAYAEEYLDLEKQIGEISAESQKKIEPLRARMFPLAEQLKNWCALFGGAHAKKSKLLTGLAYEVMTTAGSSTSLDQAAAGLFLEACKKAGKTRIFKKLFEVLTVYRSTPAADQVARTELDPKLALSFTRCFITTPHATRMEARPRKKSSEGASV
jgi:hypothetical protein